MNKFQLLLLACLMISLSCSKEPEPGIEGLWVVTQVKAGENEMTPKARWMRFNADLTQESGNGWLQHSIGTWKLDESNRLIIENSNGLKDPNEPFKVSISGSAMTWNRTEEGQDLHVYLKRASHLPTKDADLLYGLWQLKEATGKGPYFFGRSRIRQFYFFQMGQSLCHTRAKWQNKWRLQRSWA